MVSDRARESEREGIKKNKVFFFFSQCFFNLVHGVQKPECMLNWPIKQPLNQISNSCCRFLKTVGRELKEGNGSVSGAGCGLSGSGAHNGCFVTLRFASNCERRNHFVDTRCVSPCALNIIVYGWMIVKL